MLEIVRRAHIMKVSIIKEKSTAMETAVGPTFILDIMDVLMGEVWWGFCDEYAERPSF